MSNSAIKIVSRESKLALEQVKEVIIYFPDFNSEVTTLKSYGDMHKDISLMSDVPSDFFTRELDDAVLAGNADIAVHSAKDMPYILKDGLEIIALTKSADNTDSLVSKNDVSLKRLPKGAKVGTSSPERKKQILNIRPDIEIVSIRGTIEERLEFVEKGMIDAVIVATCALKRLNLSSKITEILSFETHPLQGNLAVVAKSSRADLKVIFSRIDVRQRYGKVYLAGAGPGPGDLLTFKVDNVLKHSDSIYYDDLMDETILSRYSFTERIYVGKRKGKHSFRQNEINKMLYETVKQGKIVTRLKGGDPFIFGRGGEELKYLQERLVNVEVIPGISAAQSAGASAGIPLTMRGVSSKLTLLSAHTAKIAAKYEDETVVYYMGASKLKEISGSLIKKGWPPATPVALIYKAGFIDEEIFTTNLSDLKHKKLRSPLITIIGKIAGLFKRRNKVLFTGLDPLNTLIPGRIVHYPLIEIQPLNFTVDINKYDGFVFTSRQAVSVFLSRYYITPDKKIVSIGPNTSKELLKAGYKADYESRFPDSDVLAELIKKLKLKKILYPCSNLSGNKIHELSKVETKVVYKTKERSQPEIDIESYSAVVFSSPSTVDAFFKIYERIPKHLLLYVYGKHTAEKLYKRGYVKNVQTVSPT